jgi:hypothetical protein
LRVAIDVPPSRDREDENKTNDGLAARRHVLTG